MNKEYYNKVYIPDIVKWGKITMLLGIITCFGPALVISVVYGCMPPVSAIIAGTIAQIDMLPSYRTMKYKSPIWGYFHVQKE